MSELEVKEKKSKTKAIIAVVIILLLGVAGYLAYNWNNNKKTQTMFQDPSLRSVMSIMRLSRNPETAITKDQAIKMLPLVKAMKANQKDKQVVQEKANALTALLNDKQKEALKNRRPMNGNGNSNNKGNNSGNSNSNGNSNNGGNNRGNWNGQRGSGNGQRGNRGFGAGMAGGQVSLDQIYDQLLKVLNDVATH